MGFNNLQEQGKPVKIKDEGITLVDSVSSIDFVGSGVNSSNLGDAVTESIPGGGSASDSFETVSKNLSSYDYTLNYTSGDITSIDYDLGGGNTITKTLNYTSGDITSIVLSGDTPGGIDLTKTLNYTGSDITSITYS